jgi:calcyclin binding protein
MSAFESEVAEVEHLLTLSTYAGTKSVLELHLNKLKKVESDRIAREQAALRPKVDTPVSSVPVSAHNAKLNFIPIEDFAWDQGEYNSPTISIFIDLDGVGAAKDRVQADFYENSFDLKVTDLNGKNYRLLKDNLEKNIVPGSCKCVVKANKLVLKLQKVKGEYSYEHWSSLTSKKKKDESAGAAKKDKDPMGGKYKE